MSELTAELTADWLAELDRIFAATLAQVADDSFGQPTALPGWTRGHVIAHIHFNALALCRLVGWARTEVEAPMYASPAQRAEEIEHGSTGPPARLRELATASALRFTTDFGNLTQIERARIVVTAQGRQIPAAELAWLRCRELGIHAVDLAAGTSFDDLPGGFVEALIHEVVGKRLASGEGPALAGWLTGRGSTDHLDRWL